MDFWRRQPTALRDAVGAVPIVLVFVFAQQIFGEGGSVGRAVAIVVVMGLALTFRRRWPVAAYVAALSTVAVAATGLEFLAIASYTVVERSRARLAVVAGASTLAMTVGFLHYWPALVLADVAGDLILIAGIAVVPGALGHAVRSARRTKAELEARNAELVTLRERAAEHAVEAERFRIARELHDVVAHHVSAMTVRARAGGHVAPRDPQAAEDALAYIARAGSEALTAMGSFVGALRGESTASAGTLAPQPGLEDVPALLESFRGAGLVVHEELEERPVGVAPALGLNAYRIVQEALTNAIRHGGAERAWVHVQTTGGMLRIQVDDNGRGLVAANHPHAGHGLVGIAERAALHGGTSELGPSPRGGCRLEATLHLDHAQDSAQDQGPDAVDTPTVRS